MNHDSHFGVAAVILPVALLVSGCLAGETTILNREKLSGIRAWAIVYTDEMETDDPATWVQDRTALPSRTPRSNLDLGDAIFFRLKERFRIAVTRDASQAQGVIRLHAVTFANGGCKVLYVAFHDGQNELLARTRIYPDFRKANFSYSDNFPEDAAAGIAALLASGRE